MSAAPLHVTSMPDASMISGPSSVSACLNIMGMGSSVPLGQVGTLQAGIVAHLVPDGHKCHTVWLCLVNSNRSAEEPMRAAQRTSTE